MKQNTPLMLIGFASGMAADQWPCALGPWDLYYQPQLWTSLEFKTFWQTMIYGTSTHQQLEVLPDLVPLLMQLSQTVAAATQAQQPWCVIGGDHSAAIGTWSGVAFAKRASGPIGLIWIDAHMDAHTPVTSESKNFHGMPLAHLLGYGSAELCSLLDNQPKVLPQNICLLGLRSYQPQEAAFLQNLGVTCYFMQDIQRQGLLGILKKAFNKVTRHTCGYGISLDLDAFDPKDVPGVTYPEPAGIAFAEFISALSQLGPQSPCLGIEISEYSPLNDIQQQTQKHIITLVRALYQTAFSQH